jgi:hypothetical protein
VWLISKRLPPVSALASLALVVIPHHAPALAEQRPHAKPASQPANTHLKEPVPNPCWSMGPDSRSRENCRESQRRQAPKAKRCRSATCVAVVWGSSGFGRHSC